MLFGVRIRKLLNHFEFINSNLSVFENCKYEIKQSYKSYRVEIHIPMTDIITGENMPFVAEGKWFTEDISLSEFLEYMRSLWALVLIHEMDESIHFYGKMITNQHGYPKHDVAADLWRSISRHLDDDRITKSADQPAEDASFGSKLTEHHRREINNKNNYIKRPLSELNSGQFLTMLSNFE